MKKTFKDLTKLKERYCTTAELFDFLREHNFSANILTLKKWEKKGILPEPKRKLFRGVSWRVYSKDGKDFEEILKILDKHSQKRVTQIK